MNIDTPQNNHGGGYCYQDALDATDHFEDVREMAPFEITMEICDQVLYIPLGYQARVVNTFGIPYSAVKKLFLKEINHRSKDAEENLFQIEHEVNLAISKRSEARVLIQTNEEDPTIIDKIVENMELYSDAAATYVALEAMKTIKILKGQAIFAQATKPSAIEQILLEVTGGTTNYASPDLVRSKMDEMMLDQVFHYIEDPTKTFSFSKSKFGQKTLIYSLVTYFPIGKEIAQEYYQKFFVNPSDKIVKFIPSEENTGKVKCHVLIELGLKEIPSQEKAAVSVSEYLMFNQQQKEREAARLQHLREEMKHHENQENQDSEEILILQKRLKELKKRQKRINKRIDDLSKKDGDTIIEDPYDFTSKVVFNTYEYLSVVLPELLE